MTSLYIADVMLGIIFALMTIAGLEISVTSQKSRIFGFNSLSKQSSSANPQRAAFAFSYSQDPERQNTVSPMMSSILLWGEQSFTKML